MCISVLLVEDDSELAGSLADYLSEIGFEVDFAFNGQACLELCQRNYYDVIVMDVTMPQMDGLQACQSIRQELGQDTAVLFLTARDTLDDKLAGFNSGGDDYLVKPFAPQELAARLKVLSHKNGRHSSQAITLGDIEINRPLRQVSRAGKVIALHDIQYRLLDILAQYAPAPVEREFIEKRLWPDGAPNCDALRTHIYRLRLALDKPFGQSSLKTIHGKGYRLAIPN